MVQTSSAHIGKPDKEEAARRKNSANEGWSIHVMADHLCTLPGYLNADLVSWVQAANQEGIAGCLQPVMCSRPT